jgi:hypothetical protein
MPIVVGSASAPAVSSTGNDGAASLLAVVTRICRLDSQGRVAQGPRNAYITDAFAKIDWTPEIETGIDTAMRNAAGNLAVVYRTPDLTKRYTFGIDLVAPDPELEELLTGGAVFSSSDPALTAPTVTGTPSASGGILASGSYSWKFTPMNFRGEGLPASAVTLTIVGPTGSASFNIPETTGTSAFGAYRLIGGVYQQVAVIPAAASGATTWVDIGTTAGTCAQGLPTVDTTAGYGTEGYATPDTEIDPVPCGVSVEAWSRAIIEGGPANPPYHHWVFPRVKIWNRGARTLDTGPTASTFTGFAFPNAYWGTGPDSTWTQDSSKICFRRREARTPQPQLGYQSTPLLAY